MVQEAINMFAVGMEQHPGAAGQLASAMERFLKREDIAQILALGSGEPIGSKSLEVNKPGPTIIERSKNSFSMRIDNNVKTSELDAGGRLSFSASQCRFVSTNTATCTLLLGIKFAREIPDLPKNGCYVEAHILQKKFSTPVSKLSSGSGIPRVEWNERFLFHNLRQEVKILLTYVFPKSRRC
jgi:hypothetical protein